MDDKSFWLRVALLSTLLFVGGWMRFTYLEWGEPWWFHPDERNVAMAVTRIEWFTKMDPEFFAYGSLPIYLVSACLQLVMYLGWEGDPFGIAIMIGRWWSACWSVLLISLMWGVGSRYVGRMAGVLAACLTTFTVAFVQFAHYGTFEMWLTVISLLLMITVVEFVRSGRGYWLLLASLLIGIAVGTKVTSLVLLPGIALAIFWRAVKDYRERIPRESKKDYPVQGYSNLAGMDRARLSQVEGEVEIKPKPKSGRGRLIWLLFLRMVGEGLLVLSIGTWMFVVTNPYAVNEFPELVTGLGEMTQGTWSGWERIFNPDFLHSIRTEGDIARGEIDVFYTRQFTNSTPGLFQLMKVFPYILGWPTMVIGTLGLLGLLWRGVREQKPEYLFIPLWWLLQMSFLLTLFVKWSRYMVPTLPYTILAAAWLMVACFQYFSREGLPRPLRTVTVGILSVALVSWLGWNIFSSVAYAQVFRQTGAPIVAARWAEGRWDKDTVILSEIFDLGITPFNTEYQDQITLIDFYELDAIRPEEADEKEQELYEKVKNADVFIVLARRVWANTTQHREKYPRVANFYDRLFSGELGFIKSAEFYSPPAVGIWMIDDELGAEETISVFDHPRIQIWERPGVYQNEEIEGDI